jgi:aquaglyceroporin related protein
MPSFQSSEQEDSQPTTGRGPALKGPNDTIQNSDAANAKHVGDASDTVGAGPSLQNSNNKDTVPDSEHVEDSHGLENNLTLRSTNTMSSVRTKEAEEHHTILGSVRERVGLPPEPPIIEGHEVHEHLAWSSVRVIFREPFAEFFGTFIMVLFGDGSVAQVLLSAGQTSAPGKDGFGSYQSINWGWGLGVMLGIYVAGDSGGFLNPAITLGFCTFRKLPWRRLPIYFLAQFLGGFVASGVVYANYIDAIDNVEGHGIRTVPPSTTATAGIFCTYPQAFLTKGSQFASEFVASTILMFVIFALKDDTNPGAMGKSGAGPMFPLALLFLIFGLGSCFGWETGYAINLARDFGPRLMSYIVGYGSNVWSAGEYYFWVPMVAPFCGCLFGGLLYDVFIYTGPESPINKPWWGLKGLMMNMRHGRIRSKKDLEKGLD